MAFWVEVVPPLRVVLQPFSKPCHDGVVPRETLRIVDDNVVFAIDCDELHFLTEYLESIEELNTFADRYVGVVCTVKQKEWCVDLIGIEERTLLCEELRVGPRI